MQRSCDFCGQPYEAKLSTSRFCSTNHRVQASDRRKAGLPESMVTSAIEKPKPRRSGDGTLTSSVRAQLAEADREGTPAAQAALALAERIDAKSDSASSLALAVRELRASLADALKGATDEAGVVVDLARRRRSRLAG